MMMTPVPFLGMNFSLYTSSTAGTRKERVFPEPVLAAPTRSLEVEEVEVEVEVEVEEVVVVEVVVVMMEVADLPSRRWGMVAAWISVMVVKPMSATPCRLASDTDGARPGIQILFVL